MIGPLNEGAFFWPLGSRADGLLDQAVRFMPVVIAYADDSDRC
ncbi:hypothetical protein SynA1560_02706 [Synechococcus sp. A15-60]|nr:hypothetical protein SynA1560_02706 [Synechococcus sp. A15-60]